MSDTRDIWLVLPVVNPAACNVHLPVWKERGYRIAVLQDRVHFDVPCADAVVRPWDTYAGYAVSANYLIKHVVPKDVRLVVCAGDDMRPDPSHTVAEIHDMYHAVFPEGFGVMQPTGDDLPGTDRICGSPFIGRDFARRWNHGLGPWWPGYNHYFADEEMLNVTKLYGYLHQEPALRHYHDHWTRHGAQAKPVHHAALHTRWDHDKALFLFRQAAGFPGHQVLTHV